MAMGGLSPELGAVVQATVLDGLTTKEAAILLGIPAGTVKTRMMRVARYNPTAGGVPGRIDR
jgi:RNA polymerase sigma-70 factor, ECF subfamily